MNLPCLSYGEPNLANILTMTPEKGKVETLLGKSFDPELSEERKSLQDGTLGCMSLKLLIHDELLGRSVVTNPSPRATQPPPS